jgi:hypothetical protein
MNDLIHEIFRPEELRAARTRAIDEQIKETATFARRAGDPAHRVALSELEKLLRETRQRWAEAGMVTPDAEGAGREAGGAM